MTETSGGGDHIARERLVESHLPLVQSVARRHAGRGESLDDLVQVGAIGLIKASNRFDASRGVAFATFAAPAIDGEIRRHLRDRSSSMRIPRELQRKGGELHRRRTELAAALGHSPTLGELATALETDEGQVERTLKAELAREAISLSGAGEAGDTPDTSDRHGDSEDRLLLAPSMRALSERERSIVFLRFHADLTEREIGRELGISQAHVSRLLRSALARLRTELSSVNDTIGDGDSYAGGVIPPGSGVTSILRKPTKSELRQRNARRGPAKVGEVLTTAEHRTLAEYLELPYTVTVKSERFGEDCCWSATVEELPGCRAQGNTPDEAVDQLRPAMKTWLAAALAERREIPVPTGQAVRERSAPTHSGRFLVRMPGPLHEQLAQAAKRERLSLNRFVTNALAASISPSTSPPPAGPLVQSGDQPIEPSDRSEPGPSRAFRIAFATNLVVIVIAALAAVVLLLLALQSGV